MSAGKQKQPHYFMLAPGVLYFTGQSYIVRYLPNPGLPPEALEDYVNAKLSKLYPAQHHELKFDSEIAGDQIRLIVMKNKILNEGLAEAPEAIAVCAIKGFTNLDGRFRRIVVCGDTQDIAVFDKGMLTEKSTVNRTALETLAEDTSITTHIIADKNDVQELAKLRQGANTELFSFQDTFLRAPKQYTLFTSFTKPKVNRIPLLLLVLAIILTNSIAIGVRLHAGKVLEAYDKQITRAEKLIKENSLLDKELAQYKSSGSSAKMINPGHILLAFVKAGEQVRLQSFSFDKNRFVVRGTAKNAIAFVEALKATELFGSLSLTGVQPEADGRERFSLSGEYHDKP